MAKLPIAFYDRPDPTVIAKELIGKVLCTRIDGVLTSGIIVETEAYRGHNDRASHALKGTPTPRTAVMFGPPGIAYVYLCYGIHHLFNVVTNGPQRADAVLIRALEPLEGMGTMLKRRSMVKMEPRVTMGPGSLSKAMGIDRALNGIPLVDDQVWIEDPEIMPEYEIVPSARVGVDYAGEDALLPWRFFVKGNKFVSKPRS